MAFMRSLSDHHWMCDKDAMRIDLFSVRFVLFLSPLQSKTVKEVVQRSIQTGVSYLAEQISSSIEDYTGRLTLALEDWRRTQNPKGLRNLDLHSKSCL